jgi:hypothetical protein
MQETEGEWEILTAQSCNFLRLGRPTNSFGLSARTLLDFQPRVVHLLLGMLEPPIPDPHGVRNEHLASVGGDKERGEMVLHTSSTLPTIVLCSSLKLTPVAVLISVFSMSNSLALGTLPGGRASAAIFPCVWGVLVLVLVLVLYGIMFGTPVDILKSASVTTMGGLDLARFAVGRRRDWRCME